MGILGKLYAGEPGYWHLTDKNGLPSSTVYSIIEDKQGFLFLGTPNGLVRFNGFDFKIILNPSAKSGDASDLQMDTKGNIWFSNFNHQLFVYNGGASATKLNEIDENNFNPTGKFFLDFHENLWFTNNSSIFRYDSKLKKVIQTGDSESYWQSFALNGKFGFWGATSDKMVVFDFAPYPILKKREIVGIPQMQGILRNIVYNPNNGFICQTHLKYVNMPAGFKLLQLRAFPQIKSINSFGIFKNGTVWVCTANGVAMFNANGEILNQGKLIFEGRNTSVVYEDRRGNLWVATLNDGVYMITNFDVINEIYYNSNHRENGVYSLNQYNEILYAGMQNGDIKIFDKGKESIWKTGQERSILFMAQLPNTKNYFINGTLLRFGEQLGKSMELLGAPKGLVFIGEDVYLGNNIGIYQFGLNHLLHGIADREPPEMPFFIVDEKGIKNPKGKLKKQNNRILKGRAGRVFNDNMGRVWFSVSSGIYFIQNDTFYQLQLNRNLDEMATDFCSDGKNGVYILVSNKGVYQFVNNKTELKFKLLNTNARRMIATEGKIWIGTNNGVILINSQSSKFYSIKMNDGLLSNDIQDIAYYNHRIYMGTLRGISSISTDFLPANAIGPQLFVENIRVNGVTVNLLPGSNVFKYNANNIEFDYCGIDFQSRDQLYYEYRLIGQSDSWVRQNGKISVTQFQGLPSGDYRFECRAFNDKGIVSKNMISLGFSIAKPWWRQWWFLLILLILFTSIVILLIRYYNIQKRNKEKLESNLRISQLTSLKAQMNPHFMFNALNSIQDFILLNDRVSANSFLGKFSDLMRMVLEMSNQTNISLANELKALHLYLELEAIRFEDSMKYSVTTSENLDPTEWELPSMIIQPFVENAIKHGLLHKRSDKKLSINFNRFTESNLLLVTIEDNGVGRREANRISQNRQKQHTSFATGATDERLKLLNKDAKKQIQIKFTDLEDADGNACGTKVEIQITLKAIL